MQPLSVRLYQGTEVQETLSKCLCLTAHNAVAYFFVQFTGALIVSVFGLLEYTNFI